MDGEDLTGHNSMLPSGQLQSVIERIERLETEKADIGADIKEVYAEAKGNGYDVKVLRKLVALRKKDAAKIQEEKSILELYANAIGCADLV